MFAVLGRIRLEAAAAAVVGVSRLEHRYPATSIHVGAESGPAWPSERRPRRPASVELIVVSAVTVLSTRRMRCCGAAVPVLALNAAGTGKDATVPSELVSRRLLLPLFPACTRPNGEADRPPDASPWGVSRGVMVYPMTSPWWVGKTKKGGGGSRDLCALPL